MSSDVLPATSRPVSDAKRGNVSVEGLAAMLSRGSPPPETKKAEPAATIEAPTSALATTEPAPTEAISDKAAEVATPEVVATEAESPDQEVLSQENDSPHEQLSAEAKAILERRIGKEVAKTKALREQFEARIKELEGKSETKPAELPPIVVAPTPDNPLANIQDVDSLRKEFTSAQEIKRWAEDVLDSDASEFQAGDRTFSRREVKDILRNSSRVLTEHIPARHAFLQTREAARKEALATFPFLADKSTPEYQLSQQLRRELPEIETKPNADYIAGVLVRGLRALEADKAAAAKAKPAALKQTAPRSHAETPAAPVRSNRADDEAKPSITHEVNRITGKKNLTTRELAAMLNKTSKP
jgi:hypothetical protein